MVVLFVTVTDGDAIPLNVTVAPAAKPAPVIVIELPPAGTPDVGLMLFTAIRLKNAVGGKVVVPDGTYTFRVVVTG